METIYVPRALKKDDIKLGDYLEPEADRLFVKLENAQKLEVDGELKQGSVVYVRNATTKAVDVYVQIDLVRVKDEPVAVEPDEYDRFEFSRDQVVSDVRVVVNRSVDFVAPFRDPDHLLNDDGTDHYIEGGTYSVNSKTLEWVAANDPYFLFNEYVYDPKFLEQFGMENDWVNHDTLFLPAYENDAWQYDQTPWFAATVQNLADENAKPGEPGYLEPGDYASRLFKTSNK